MIPWGIKCSGWFLRMWVLFFSNKKHFQFVATSVHKICVAKIFTRNFIVDRCSTNRNLLIETMVREISKIVMKKIDSVCHDHSHKYALVDNFRLWNFGSKKANTLLHFEVAFHKKTSTESLIEETYLIFFSKFRFQLQQESNLRQILADFIPESSNVKIGVEDNVVERCFACWKLSIEKMLERFLQVVLQRG